MEKRKYHVEVVEFEYAEWNKHFDFDSLDAAVAYCKELDFQGHVFNLTSYYVNEEAKA